LEGRGIVYRIVLVWVVGVAFFVALWEVPWAFGCGVHFWRCGIYVCLCIFHGDLLALGVFEVMTYSLRFRHCIALVSVHVLILALPDCFFSLLFSGIQSQ
jgi:hypothetical protein